MRRVGLLCRPGNGLRLSVGPKMRRCGQTVALCWLLGLWPGGGICWAIHESGQGKIDELQVTVRANQPPNDPVAHQFTKTIRFNPEQLSANATVGQQHAEAQAKLLDNRDKLQARIAAWTEGCGVVGKADGNALTRITALMFVRGIPRGSVTDINLDFRINGGMELSSAFVPPNSSTKARIEGFKPLALLDIVVQGLGTGLQSAPTAGGGSDTILLFTNLADPGNTAPSITITNKTFAERPLEFVGVAEFQATIDGLSFVVTGDWAGDWAGGNAGGALCNGPFETIDKTRTVEIRSVSGGLLGVVQMELLASNEAAADTSSASVFGKELDIGGATLGPSGVPAPGTNPEASVVFANLDEVTLLFLPGTQNPTNAIVILDRSKPVPVAQFELSSYIHDVTVNAMTLAVTDTNGAGSQVSSLRLYRDVDEDGQVSDADVRIGTDAAIASGKATFDTLDETVKVGQRESLLVVAEFGAPTVQSKAASGAVLLALLALVPVLGLVGLRRSRREARALLMLGLLLAVGVRLVGCILPATTGFGPAAGGTLAVQLAADTDVSATAADELTIIGAPVKAGTFTLGR